MRPSRYHSQRTRTRGAHWILKIQMMTYFCCGSRNMKYKPTGSQSSLDFLFDMKPGKRGGCDLQICYWVPSICKGIPHVGKFLTFSLKMKTEKVLEFWNLGKLPSFLSQITDPIVYSRIQSEKILTFHLYD